MAMLKGNVTPKDMGRYNPSLACGNDCFIAAGTAIYDALANKIQSNNPVPGLKPMSHEKPIAMAAPINGL